MTGILVFLICSLLPAENTVTAEGVLGIGAETTREDLDSIFSPEELEDTREHLGEGYYAEGTVVLPGSPFEVSLVWDQGTLVELRIQGDSLRTLNGIGLGTSLEEIVITAGEVEVAGFAWDMEGFVSLSGTPLEGLFLRVTPEGSVPEEYMGDSMFFSEDLQELDLRVTDFRILFQ